MSFEQLAGLGYITRMMAHVKRSERDTLTHESYLSLLLDVFACRVQISTKVLLP